MAIFDQRHPKVSKQTTLSDDVGAPKWRVCGRGLNQCIHEGMNNISNVKVYLRTRSGGVNITTSYTCRLVFHIIKIHQKLFDKQNLVCN